VFDNEFRVPEREGDGVLQREGNSDESDEYMAASSALLNAESAVEVDIGRVTMEATGVVGVRSEAVVWEVDESV